MTVYGPRDAILRQKIGGQAEQGEEGGWSGWQRQCDVGGGLLGSQGSRRVT